MPNSTKSRGRGISDIQKATGRYSSQAFAEICRRSARKTLLSPNSFIAEAGLRDVDKQGAIVRLDVCSLTGRPMRILFLHQNFPAQFLHASAALRGRKGVEIIAVTHESNRRRSQIPTRAYTFNSAGVSNNLALAAHYTQRIARAEAVAPTLDLLRREGFEPDLVVGHGGWGETLFVHDIWPKTKILLHAEFYYSASGADVGFDPEFYHETPLQSKIRIRARNTIMLQALFDAERGVTFTRWQASQFPPELARKIAVVHEGVDTERAKPDRSATVALARNNLAFSASDEIVTFVSRNLEPYRGFHVFMRALPAIMRSRPKAHFVIVGGDGEGYGSGAPGGRSWKSVFFDEVRDELDVSRLHFVGRIAHQDFIRLMQISTVHVYLTYPFVLSWSLLEAMSCGALVVASATPPVEEVVEDGRNGLLVPFFDVEALSDKVIEALKGDRWAHMRLAARRTVVDRYDLKTKCLPEWLALIEQTADC